MVTKAELEAELAVLRKELADRKATTSRAGSEPDDAESPNGRAALETALSSLGLDPSEVDLEGLWRKLSDEVGDAAQKRPALTAVAIFALGFVLGRMSK